MKDFNWANAKSTLEDFGGVPVRLHVSKTGLPFFDALRLYGAIDLYIGLREDLSILDNGDEWTVRGRSRTARLSGRDEEAFKGIWTKSKPDPSTFCADLRHAVIDGKMIPDSQIVGQPDRRFFRDIIVFCFL